MIYYAALVHDITICVKNAKYLLFLQKEKNTIAGLSESQIRFQLRFHLHQYEL